MSPQRVILTCLCGHASIRSLATKHMGFSQALDLHLQQWRAVTAERGQVLVWFVLCLCVHKKYLKQYCTWEDCWKGHISGAGTPRIDALWEKDRFMDTLGSGGHGLSCSESTGMFSSRQTTGRVGSHRRIHSAREIAHAVPPYESWGFVVICFKFVENNHIQHSC